MNVLSNSSLAGAPEINSTAKHVIQALLYIILIVLGVILNGAVLWLFRKHRSLQTITNLWVCSLCLSQLFISSISLCIALISTVNGDWIFGRMFCQVYGYFTFVLRTVTILSVAAIALDRYHVIIRPFKKRIKKKVAKTFISSLWWTSFVICSPPLIGIGSFRYSPTHNTCQVSWSLGGPALIYTSFYVTSAFASTCITAFWCYALIYKNTKAHAVHQKKVTITRSQSENRLKNAAAKPTTSNKKKKLVNLFSISHPASSVRGQHDSHKIGIDRQITKVIIILLLVFVATWAPYFFYAVLCASSGKIKFPFSPVTQWIEFLVTWLSFSTCVSDPILYGIYTRNFQGLFKKHFFFWKQIDSVNTNSSETWKSTNKMTSQTRHLPLTSAQVEENRCLANAEGEFRPCPLNRLDSAVVTPSKTSSLRRNINSLRNRWPTVTSSANESFVNEEDEEFYENFESILDLTYQQPNSRFGFRESPKQFTEESMQTSSAFSRIRPVCVLSDISLLSAETAKRYEKRKILHSQLQKTNSIFRSPKLKSQTTLPVEKNTKPLPFYTG